MSLALSMVFTTACTLTSGIDETKRDKDKAGTFAPSTEDKGGSAGTAGSAGAAGGISLGGQGGSESAGTAGASAGEKAGAAGSDEG